MKSKKASFAELINTPTPILVDFYADWCAPCKMLTPTIQQLASVYKQKLKVIKINTEKNNALSAKYNIQSIPTLMLFKNGQSVWRQSGVIPYSVLEQEIKKHI